jgi:hypothetical protein
MILALWGRTSREVDAALSAHVAGGTRPLEWNLIKGDFEGPLTPYDLSAHKSATLFPEKAAET